MKIVEIWQSFKEETDQYVHRIAHVHGTSATPQESMDVRNFDLKNKYTR